MLLNFRVSNFLSFNQEVEFSMLAGQVKQSENHVTTIGKDGVGVLKGAVVYGANASGKSNLIKAIDFARQVVVGSFKNIHARNSYFRLEKGAEEKLSEFELEIKIGEKVYAYGFVLQLNIQKVKEEWLFEIKKSNDKAIFERKVLADGSSDMTSKPPHLRGNAATRFGVYTSDISSEQLLLNELHDKAGEGFAIFREVFDWFENQLVTFYPHSGFAGAEVLLKEGAPRDQFCEYLNYFKTGIDGIDGKETNLEEALPGFTENLRAKVVALIDKGSRPVFGIGKKRFVLNRNSSGEIIANSTLTQHRVKNSSEKVSFDFEEESDGSRRIFDLIPLLLMLNQGPQTIFIDEIDRSLHPELTRRLLEAFFQKNRQPDSQLVLTTHESSLLDLSLLRRDEIWFAEKNADGESRLYSLEEFKPRFDTEIRKAYLQGRYGAIPFIADVSQLGWQEN